MSDVEVVQELKKLRSGAVVLVSGQTVELQSGTGPIAGITISGAVVYISGQHVFVESGAVVLISGQTVELQSGTGPIAGISISGAIVQISGQHIYQESGAVVLVSGQFVYTSAVVSIASGSIVTVSGNYLYLESGTGPVLTSVSGNVVYVSGTVVAKMSGEYVELQSGTGPILTSVSGNVLIVLQSGNLIVKVSGETVELESGTGPVLTSVSGNILIAKISGQDIEIIPLTDVKTYALRIIPASSGGVYLHSGSVHTVTLKAKLTNSGDIFVGGDSVTNRPYSGYGFELEAGEALTLDMDDFDTIKLYATVSGDRVTFIGADK